MSSSPNRDRAIETHDSLPTLPDQAALLQVFQGLDTGLAIVQPETWTVVFENAKFFKWFPLHVGEGEPLTERMPDLKPSRALSRLEKGRAYSFELEVESNGRTVPVAVEMRALPDHKRGYIVLECRDISKRAQAQYLLESYSKMAERNARELQREKERAERLLLNIMPKSVMEEMKDYGTVTPQLFENATILMLDFVGSTEMAISRDPTALVTELNDIFTVFDRITDLFNCERMKTIGDAYMVVSGLPEPAPDHAFNVARVALRMLRYIERRNMAHPEPWLCRIGINTGPVVGSLVGVQKYVYDIFGPGVNLAARMEANSEPMRITISDATYELIKDDFACTERGQFEIKGFGEQTLYFLDRELTPGDRWE
jgi:class 3 adenylate cyclase